MPKFPVFIMLTAVLVGGCGEPEDTRPGQPVKQRQTAFKEIIRAFEPMGVMLRKEQFDGEKFARLAKQLDNNKDAPWPHFGPDTNYPPTKSTPEVWQQPAQFEHEKQAFLDAVQKLSAAAESKTRDRVEAPYQAVYDSCKSCHKTFKKR